LDAAVERAQDLSAQPEPASELAGADLQCRQRDHRAWQGKLFHERRWPPDAGQEGSAAAGFALLQADTELRTEREPAVMAINIKVNGAMHSVTAAPDTPLLYVLRNDLGLNAAKFGCGLAQCGACTVLIDGKPARSCVTPIDTLGQSEITTLEGLGTLEHPHPLQAAFMTEQAAQCGYCIAGMIMAAKALLDRNPQPSAAEVRQALAENLCRCGTHNRIVRAVLRAAQNGGRI